MKTSFKDSSLTVQHLTPAECLLQYLVSLSCSFLLTCSVALRSGHQHTPKSSKVSLVTHPLVHHPLLRVAVSFVGFTFFLQFFLCMVIGKGSAVSLSLLVHSHCSILDPKSCCAEDELLCSPQVNVR